MLKLDVLSGLVHMQSLEFREFVRTVVLRVRGIGFPLTFIRFFIVWVLEGSQAGILWVRF